MNVLVEPLQQVPAQPTATVEKAAPAAFKRSAMPVVDPSKLAPCVVATSYLGGSTVNELAKLHGVSASTRRLILQAYDRMAAAIAHRGTGWTLLTSIARGGAPPDAGERAGSG
jgi:hypothetical protein